MHPETLVWRGGNYFWSLMFALCSARSCVPTPPSAFLFNDIEWTCGRQLFVELVWLIYHLPNMQDSNQEYGDFTLGRWIWKIMPFSNRPVSHTSSRQNFWHFPSAVLRTDGEHECWECGHVEGIVLLHWGWVCDPELLCLYFFTSYDYTDYS